MSERVVGVLYDPWHDAARGGGGAVVGRYYRAVAYKANPRSGDYMRALFDSALPGGRLVAVAPGWHREIADADLVVLLYPDAIGLWFDHVERQVRGHLRAGAQLWALNGRRRRFRLTPRTRRRLAVRRFLERTMLVEAVLAMVVAITTPALAAFDILRGRR